MRMLSESEWRPRAEAHAKHADALTASHLARRARGIKHPIEDFLFTYYTIKPGELRRWHPGAGVTLENGRVSRETWRYYATPAPHGSDIAVDLKQFFAKRGKTVDYIYDLLSRTLDRTPQYGCFGLHEWAMVYHLTPEALRHRGLTLRIGHDATDKVVENHRIGCSHFDAYRFFTPDAAPLNTLNPTRENQPDMDQPGCLHAGMDIYKWIGKLGPIVPGEMLLEAFELARDIRIVDMQASPYDVSEYGYEAIPIETAEGKHQYAELQQGFAQRGNALRAQVLKTIDHARSQLGDPHINSLVQFEASA